MVGSILLSSLTCELSLAQTHTSYTQPYVIKIFFIIQLVDIFWACSQLNYDITLPQEPLLSDCGLQGHLSIT